MLMRLWYTETRKGKLFERVSGEVIIDYLTRYL